MRLATSTLALALVCGCANTILGTVGDAGDVAVADAPSAFNMEFEVVLGRREQGERRAGIAVRAEASTGGAVEGRTTADGTVRLLVDPALVYTVTVAEPGYVARSLFDVRAGFRATIRLPRQIEQGSADLITEPVTATVAALDPSRSVVFDGANGSALSHNGTATFGVSRWTGAPTTFWLSAVELDAMSQITRGGFVGGISRRSPGRVNIAFTQRIQRDVLIVEFSQVGRLTPVTVRRALDGAVLRFKQTDLGEGGVVVGRSTVELPQSSGQTRWVIDHFEGDLAPEMYFVRVATDTLTATVSSRPSFAGLTLAFPAVSSLSTRASTAGIFEFNAAVAPWTRGRFTVRSMDGTPRWEGYSVEVGARMFWSVPTMPSGVMASSIFGSATLVGQTCVARDAPIHRASPWAEPRIAMEMWSLLSACEAGVTGPPPQ